MDRVKKEKKRKVIYCFSKSDSNKSLLMNGDIAASNALGHSSCGRWPHPDIATSLCIENNTQQESTN